jgi:hypothetical protein
MRVSFTGRAPWRVIVIQLLILVGLAVFFKFYLPHRARASAKQEAVTREQKLTTFFQDSVETDSTHEISVPLGGAIVKRHPQKLRLTFSPQQAESALGVPTSVTTDFRGGQHLIWTGTAHQLEASFDAGHLYCLGLEDRATGHGVLVYESFQLWHPY